MRTGHSACSVSTLDSLTDEDMTKYTVKVRPVTSVMTCAKFRDKLSYMLDASGPEDGRQVGGDQGAGEEEQESPGECAHQGPAAAGQCPCQCPCPCQFLSTHRMALYVYIDKEMCPVVLSD